MKLKKSANKSKISSNIGKLLIVSGPSGVGKGTICQRLLELDNSFVFSVSATTRAPRQGEVDGESYFFITKEKFNEMIEQDKLLEYDNHFDNFYGTPLDYVLENVKKGKNVILEIDFKGAMQVKKKYPQAITVFIDTPSYQELIDRLVKRNTESQEQIQLRLNRVETEMANKNNYDYVIVNDTVDNAVNKILQLIKENK